MTQNLTPALREAQEGAFGPAMCALPTDHMRAFVIAMLDAPTISQADAAARAGYTGLKSSLEVTGYRLMHDERVLKAFDEEARRRLRSGGVVAVSTLIELCKTGKAADRINAAAKILNRIGMHEKTEHKVEVTDMSKTDQALIERTKTLAAKLGLDASELLGSLNIVDAEFSEVPPQEALPAPAEEDWSAWTANDTH